MKRSNGVLLIAGALLILILILAVSVPHEPLGTGVLPWLGTHLTEEVQPQDIITTSTTALTPGTVWQIEDSPNGIKIQPRTTQLIEKIQLNDTVLESSDLLAPHLFDWYFDGNAWIKLAKGNTTSAVFNYTTVSVQTRIYDQSPNDLNAHAVIWEGSGVAAGQFMWGLVSRYSKPAIFLGNATVVYHLDGSTLLTGSWHTIFASFGSGSASIYVDGNSDASGTYTLTPTEFNRGAKIGEAYGSVHIFEGKIAYVAVWNAKLTPPTIENVLDAKPLSLLDATFYNGTHYVDLIGAVTGTPYYVVRLPATQTWLWLIKSGTTDGKLHVKYVPPGSILKIHYNGMVYEWRITGTPNAAGLIEDYAIDLASAFGLTTIPNATVELVYPSQKIRVYGPPGFTLKLIGNGWNQTAVIPDNASYVDFSVPDGNYTLQVLGYDVQPGVNIEVTGDTVRVTVTNENREALPGAKVYVYDTSGQLVFAGTTNDLGMVSFNKTSLASDQARIVVTYLYGGKYYHVDKVVSLTSNYHIEPVTPTPTENSNLAAGVEQAQTSAGIATIIIVLLLVLLATLVVLLRRGHLK